MKPLSFMANGQNWLFMCGIRIDNWIYWERRWTASQNKYEKKRKGREKNIDNLLILIICMIYNV